MAKYARLGRSAVEGAVTLPGGGRKGRGSEGQNAPRQKATSSRQGSNSMKLTGAQILWECLVREGVTEVFGYPGGAILPAYDALLDYPIRHIAGAPRAGRDAHGRRLRARDRPVGVAIATSGPGATNMVTGIATAMLDSSPIVCITGQVGSKLIGTDAFQEIDITGITLPVTKHNYLVTRPQDVAPRGARGVPDRAIGAARAGADRHHQGRAAGVVRVRLGRRGAAPGRGTPRCCAPSGVDCARAAELIHAASGR